jgi:hypothetical protein
MYRGLLTLSVACVIAATQFNTAMGQSKTFKGTAPGTGAGYRERDPSIRIQAKGTAPGTGAGYRERVRSGGVIPPPPPPPPSIPRFSVPQSIVTSVTPGERAFDRTGGPVHGAAGGAES